MNKSNAKQYLPLVQALAEGKTIQYKRSVESDWVDMANTNFIYAPTRYRIKPERIKKKMWYKKGMVPMYDANAVNTPDTEWIINGWKLVDVELDAP